jgi:hypothetical protein
VHLVRLYSGCGAQWEHFCNLFQKLLDEHQNVYLLQSSFAAAATDDFTRRAAIMDAAHRRLRACSINFANVVASANALYKKPLLLDAQVFTSVV